MTRLPAATAPASTAKGGTVVFDTATGQFSYTPSDDARHAAAADGASPDDLVDTFAVTVDDGHGGTTVVPVTVTLVPVNADPVATVTVGARDENGVVTGTVSATDADGDAPRFSGPATSAKGGTITVDALTGEFTYTPSEEA
ncbi:Ig-like domain-containing protein, partial [uncultured Nocardioides sp.]|uniref:Ig-like domain-containing protein n=1 Tax=uncultured Nocardioides sp. TaxID=198441 RepID=UPI00261A2E81